IVTKDLFEQYPTLDSLSQANHADIYAILKPCGLGKTKAKDTIATSKMLIEKYNRILPDSIEELTKLPGIGRKTANLIMGDIYGQPAIVCDTHCIRITNHIGLSTSTNPIIVERELKAVLPPSESSDFCHRMVLHGRAVCKARSPLCELCCVKDLCNDYKKKIKK
ncbi:MAG: endonuclease III, partial [Oscillospiraceae bacterium]